MINRWFLELKRASIGDCRVLRFLGDFGAFWNTSSLRKRAELSKDEEPLGCRKLGRLPVGKEPETSPTESAAKDGASV